MTKENSVEKVIGVFEKLSFENKVQLFDEIRAYMKRETDKSLDEAKYKVEQYSKLQASIGQ